MRISVVAPVLGVILFGCAPSQEDAPPEAEAAAADWEIAEAAMGAIEAPRFRENVETLSSDAFGGRAPFSEGETLTLELLEQAFSQAGFQPANGNSYRQPVSLVSIEAEPQNSMTLNVGDESRQLAFGADMVAWTKRVVETSSVEDSQLVFVGYGVVAPEYGWDDYAGIDMTGKTAVMLVNDPGYATQDEALFNGNSMTYYGRWTYKFEEAARQGATGALVIHETGAAGYPWEVVTGSWTGAQFDLASEDGNMGRAAVEGWITEDQGKAIFDSLGLNYGDAIARAQTSEFKPMPLDATISLTIRNTLVKSQSFNVAAVLPGSETPDEYFVYMAHWDHLGTAPTGEGDRIFNGAVDNATGTAALVELANAFAALPKAPRRSIMMLAVTAEESGLLGSAQYGATPLVALNKTVGGINMDAMNVLDRTNDVVVIGKGSSELEEYLQEEAARQGRELVEEPTPEKGYFYRSDHFNFAKRGVPVLYAKSGVDYVGKGVEWGLARQADYVANRYHKAGDEYDPSWSLAGALQDMELYFAIGYRVANDGAWPNWYEGNEFRAIRDASLSQ